MYRELSSRAIQNSVNMLIRACLREGGGPQVSEVTRLGGVKKPVFYM